MLRYGSLPLISVVRGTVKWISPDVVVNEQTGMSFYKIQISVTQEELALLKDHILIPGIPIEAFVNTGERTALNYLIKPLLDQINRAFKEE
ncbi:MAG: hypothetical protein HRU28_11120 [Rhizobiales bacterium]|nr:hypothetical protein [Hyphomicrobiales bacterium]